VHPEREFYEEIPSTQDRALELARAGAPQGTRVVAARQTQGRGRADHRWFSPGGGLHLSIVLASREPGETLLPLALGASLADALAGRSTSPLRVKWPNDVLAVPEGMRCRKLAGILVDLVPSPSLGSAAVAGIGVNVVVDPDAYPPVIRPNVVGLSELCDPPPTLVEVEREVVGAALSTAEALLRPAGRAAVLARCRALLWGVGRRATLDGAAVGRIVGLADDGALWVERDGDRVAIRAGDLRVDETG
jgi:BirA family transcriptional regulator, biotin operon repressor / biotin---[acetyl-CoA-carboxylase] ligase